MTLRVNATGEYLLPELGAGAATEDGVIVFFAGRDKMSSSELEVELGIKRRNMLRDGYGYTCLVHVRRVVTIYFASTLTWSSIGMDGELRRRILLDDVWSVNGSCDVGFCFVFGMVQYRYCGWR